MSIQRKPKGYVSLLAGMSGGMVEIFVTYPTEFVKTQLQLPDANKRFKSPIDCLIQTIQRQGVKALYRGVGAMIIGNGLKAGVRFGTYDHIKEALRDKDGNLTLIRTIIAGACAGIAEGALVVTPAETIKTKFIQDQNSKNPQYKGLISGVRTIIKTEGFIGIYKGLIPVVLRQTSNSAIRLSIYQVMRDQITKHKIGLNSNSQPTFISTFIMGMIAGTITVYATMPIDNVKTKMQSLGGERFGGPWNCFKWTIKNEGVKALWKGATPRLGRLLFSGGITFSVYEKVVQILS